VSDGGGTWTRGRGWLVAASLLALTAGALLIPPEPLARGDGTLLVLLPVGEVRRGEALEALAAYLGRQARLDLRVQIAGDRQAFAEALPTALVTLCPDGLGLDLPTGAWQALATGRRRVPWNQRPASVLVGRRSLPPQTAPWRTAPARTVFGDSLSLVCLAPLCEDGRREPLPATVGWGRDPYDHRAVLAAAVHGAYDHAVVREWDAAAALAEGWLDPAHWRVERLSDPLPDVVVFASRRLTGAVRLDLQEALALLGRDDAVLAPADHLVEVQLGHLGLDGFNLLLGPEVERLRRQYDRCWPHAPR
jgi:hypothetical protein